MSILLEEFDFDSSAMIEPAMVAEPMEGFPELAVTCYSKRLLERVLRERNAEVLCQFDTEDGDLPIYRIYDEGKAIAVYMSRVGAPACAMQLDEVISRGAKKIMMFGSCGVLGQENEKWSLIVPKSAIRDEGTSYHYLSAAEEVFMAETSVSTICKVLKEAGEPYLLGAVWTTDAMYRETRNKLKQRRKQGCIAVDMECAAALAVTQFRNISFGQFFYTEDLLGEDEWQHRGLTAGVSEQAQRLFDLAVACGKEL